MKAVAQLWLLPSRQMPLLGVVAHLAWLTALACLIGITPRAEGASIGAGVLAMGSWFWHLGLASTLRGACQPESFLLPAFRRHLAVFGLVDATIWVGLPVVVALAFGVPHALLGGTLLLLAAAMGFAMGVERWISLLFWPLLVLAGWMPGLMVAIVHDALASPMTLPLLLLVAALLLRLALHPMLRINDRPPDTSPLEGLSLGRGATSDNVPRRSALGRRFEGWFDAIAQQSMERALARYRERPGTRRRRVLLRRLLLPHDNPVAIALRVAIMALFATLYVVVALHRQHFNATVVGAYAVLIALARFPQVGRGMQRMRPNLADLYLTMAPGTRSQYQQALADALLVLVPIGTLTALAYTALGIVLIRAAQPGLMLLVTLIVATGGGLVSLAVHLIGPQGAVGRQVVNAVVLMGTVAMYWAGVWAVDTLGHVAGGGLLALVVLGFGLGVWFAAQREYLRRDPCFDAPLS
ncbi:hypothetical protein [Frateuria sp. STR12]|uniref:hypothetical protein n=1 Tax=Frateuria hangzhouensis TaxID=2995589 RepID=UPI002260E365|nr:hypothetical protein [Frateuria sp. STR12]MCX7514432.1 hypothetical protein [Frateuria sp. STR12]